MPFLFSVYAGDLLVARDCTPAAALAMWGVVTLEFPGRRVRIVLQGD